MTQHSSVPCLSPHPRQSSPRMSTLRWTFLSLLLFTVLALLTPGLAHAQAIYGSINGTVLDPAGAAVVGATVTVTDVAKDTTKVAKTNETGFYVVHNLIPDPYTVKVEAQGFQQAQSDQIKVSADSTELLNISLKIGSNTQTVQVTSAAPELKTDRADVATELDSMTLAAMPNISRNITTLVLLTPGTTASTFSNANAEDPQRSIPIAANGQSPFSSGFILDGADDKDGFIGETVLNPPQTSVSEVKFINQNYDAEFGAAVAGILVMQTKSGSNTFHGTVYDFRRSDAQQARDPFTQYPHNNPLGPDIPNTMSSIYGGNIGGPIWKNKLFFFGDYQGTRQKIGSSFFETVPTALVHSTCGVAGVTYCDLSEYLTHDPTSGAINGGQVYDPHSTPAANFINGNDTGIGRTAFAGNLIPNSSLSTAALNLLKIIPGPSKPGINNNFVASGFGVYNFNQFDGRIDEQLRQNLHLFGRYGYLGSTQSSPGSLGQAGGNGYGSGGWAGTESGGNHSLAAGADLALSTKLLTDFRFTYMRYAFVEAKYNGQTPLMTTLGWTGLNTSALESGGASEIQIDGQQSLGSGNHGAGHCNCPLDMTEQEYGFVNNWTRDFSNHTVKVGAELRIMHVVRIPSDTSRAGEVAFQQGRTALGVAGGSTANASGVGLASMLFGDVSTFSRFFSLATNNPPAETQPRFFAYAQDNWKVSPKLTLNLGVRWESYFPEHVNGKDQGGFYNIDTGMIEVAGEGNFNNSMNVQNNWTLFAPRVGFAYQLTPRNVIRGGLGRSFDPGFYGDIFAAVLSQTIPVLQTQSLSQGGGKTTDAARNNDGSIYNIATGPSAPISAFVIPSSGEFVLPVGQGANARPTKQRVPDVYGWNLSYQAQISSSTAITLAYVANKTTHGLSSSTWGGINWNDATMQGYQQGLPCNGQPFYEKFKSLYPSTNCNGWLTYYIHMANAHYNSFQAIVEHRLGQGLQLSASYVLSRATGVGSVGDFYWAPKANWGRFDFNRPNNFKLNGTYSLPFGRGQQIGANMDPIASAIVGGFSLNGIVNWGSGLPFGASYNLCRDEAPDWDMPCRPDKVGSFNGSKGSLDPVSHTVRFFTPVAPLASEGQTSGAFRRPKAYTWGNMEYNGLNGPGLITTDLSLKKNIPIHKDLTMSLEVMAQNAFNHVNLSNPNGCIDCTSGGPGLITDIQGGTFAGMRQLQFAAHVTF